MVEAPFNRLVCTGFAEYNISAITLVAYFRLEEQAQLGRGRDERIKSAFAAFNRFKRSERYNRDT